MRWLWRDCNGWKDAEALDLEGERELRDFWISFWSGFKNGAGHVFSYFALIGLVGAFIATIVLTACLILETFGIIVGVLFIVLFLSAVAGVCFGIKVWTIYRKLKYTLDGYKELLEEEGDTPKAREYRDHISRIEGKIKRLLSGNYNEFFR